MKVSELFEGMYVVKNKDGKEKRFKTAESPEAKAWKESSSPSKVQLTAYSQAWWEKKDETATSSLILPWDKIDSDDVSEQFDRIAKEHGFGRIEDWYVQGRGEVKVDDVHSATVKVRMVFSFGKEDDLGLDIKGDERVSDSQYVKLRRDTTNPKKLVFAGYTN